MVTESGGLGRREVAVETVDQETVDDGYFHYLNCGFMSAFLRQTQQIVHSKYMPFTMSIMPQ